MESSQTTKTILFDLDNTLFDHKHSLRSAISAVQEKYPSFAMHHLEHLVDKYDAALQQAYDKYLQKEITYAETNAIKVRQFFTQLGMPEPSLKEVDAFRAIYKTAYQANRRATPGSVETLTRLRENSYRLAIVTNGQIEDQTAKADAIGVRHLVDRIVTSEEAGCCKPDPRIFQIAVEALNSSPSMTHMVGDSIEADIKGALDAGLSATLYSPGTPESRRFLFGSEVHVIQHMGQFLDHLDNGNP